MTPYEAAEALYAGRLDMDFGADLMAHAYAGHVIARPDLIVMARAVRKDWQVERFACIYQTAKEQADCWFIWLLCGSLREAVKHLPYPLPWFGFCQRGGPPRFIEAEKVLAKLR